MSCSIWKLSREAVDHTSRYIAEESFKGMELKQAQEAQPYGREPSEGPAQPIEVAPQQMNELLDRSIEDLELSVRFYNILKNANVRTIGDLVQKTEAEMRRRNKVESRIVGRDQGASFQSGTPLGMKTPAPHFRPLAFLKETQ